MSIDSNQKIKRRGFTLVEVLIAISLFGITMTMLFTSFRTVFFSGEAIKNNVSQYEMVKNCLDRISKDLQGIHISMPPFYEKPEFDSSPDSYRVVGDNYSAGEKSFPRLRFTSMSHISFLEYKRSGIAEIIYYMRDLPSGGYALCRSDRLFPYEEFKPRPADPVLCENMEKIEFTYFDSDGDVFSEWDSEDDTYAYGTPVAIGIEIEAGGVKMKTRVKLNVYRPESE